MLRFCTRRLPFFCDPGGMRPNVYLGCVSVEERDTRNKPVSDSNMRTIVCSLSKYIVLAAPISQAAEIL